MTEKQKMLIIYTGDLAKYNHRPLYEAIVYAAKRAGLDGATVFRGIMSYGPTSMVHSTKMFSLSSDLPIKIEIIDRKEKIEQFADLVKKIFEKSGSAGLIAMQDAEIMKIKSK